MKNSHHSYSILIVDDYLTRLFIPTEQ